MLHGALLSADHSGIDVSESDRATYHFDLLDGTMDDAMERSKTITYTGLVVSVAICLGAGGLGAIATASEIDGWYATINKPSWNPPGWVFGPVWTTLYILMAVSAWLVWKSEKPKTVANPLILFTVQLALNVAWSWIFFGMHQPGWAFAEIIVLWLTIIATTVAFFRRSKIAGSLMLPYLAWVSFASLLNFVIWRMNTG